MNEVPNDSFILTPKVDLDPKHVEEVKRRFVDKARRWREGGESRLNVKRLTRFGKNIRDLRMLHALSPDSFTSQTGFSLDFLFFLEGGYLLEEEIVSSLDGLAKGLNIDTAELNKLLAATNTNPGF